MAHTLVMSFHRPNFTHDVELVLEHEIVVSVYGTTERVLQWQHGPVCSPLFHGGKGLLEGIARDGSTSFVRIEGGALTVGTRHPLVGNASSWGRGGREEDRLRSDSVVRDRDGVVGLDGDARCFLEASSFSPSSICVLLPEARDFVTVRCALCVLTLRPLLLEVAREGNLCERSMSLRKSDAVVNNVRSFHPQSIAVRGMVLSVSLTGRQQDTLSCQGGGRSRSE